MATIFVEYIGTKARKNDNVNFPSTGAVWDGPGAIVEMDAASATKCLEHTTVWAVANPERVTAAGSVPKVAAPKVAAKTDELEEEKDRVIHQVNLQKMNREDLFVYARKNFNKDFDPETTIQELRKQIRVLRIGAGIANG